MGEQDIAFLCPRDFALEMESGTRLSLFPMGPVRGTVADGVAWTFRDKDFAPMAQIGTSNRATGGVVRMQFDADAMLVILPHRMLEPAFMALGGSTDAPDT